MNDQRHACADCGAAMGEWMQPGTPRDNEVAAMHPVYICPECGRVDGLEAMEPERSTKNRKGSHGTRKRTRIDKG